MSKIIRYMCRWYRPYRTRPRAVILCVRDDNTIDELYREEGITAPTRQGRVQMVKWILEHATGRTVRTCIARRALSRIADLGNIPADQIEGLLT